VIRKNVAKVHPFQAFYSVNGKIVAKVHPFDHESSVYAYKLGKSCTFASFLAIIAWNAKIDALLQLFRWNSQSFFSCRILLKPKSEFKNPFH
jgi:hypothetical protein